MMTHRWRDVTRDSDEKAHSDLNYVSDIMRYTSTSPFHVPDRDNREMWKL